MERTFLIHKSGRVLAEISRGAAPAGLPRLAGEGAPAEAARLYALLAAQPVLLAQVKRAERVGER